MMMMIADVINLCTFFYTYPLIIYMNFYIILIYIPIITTFYVNKKIQTLTFDLGIGIINIKYWNHNNTTTTNNWYNPRETNELLLDWI